MYFPIHPSSQQCTDTIHILNNQIQISEKSKHRINILRYIYKKVSRMKITWLGNWKVEEARLKGGRKRTEEMIWPPSYSEGLSSISAIAKVDIFLKFWNSVKILKFGWNSEIWSKFSIWYASNFCPNPHQGPPLDMAFLNQSTCVVPSVKYLLNQYVIC